MKFLLNIDEILKHSNSLVTDWWNRQPLAPIYMEPFGQIWHVIWISLHKFSICNISVVSYITIFPVHPARFVTKRFGFCWFECHDSRDRNKCNKSWRVEFLSSLYHFKGIDYKNQFPRSTSKYSFFPGFVS